MATNFPGNTDSFTTRTDNVDNVIADDVNSKGDAITKIEQKIGITNSATPTVNGDFVIDYFLKNASGAYRTHTHDGSSDDGALVPIANIAEVSIADLVNQQYLRYNSSSGKWENYTFTYPLSSLSDVVISSPVSKEGLFYNSGTSKWNNGYANAVYAS